MTHIHQPPNMWFFPAMYVHLILTRGCLLILKREREGRREAEEGQSVASCMHPNWGWNLRHVWCIGQCSNHCATQLGLFQLYFYLGFKIKYVCEAIVALTLKTEKINESSF